MLVLAQTTTTEVRRIVGEPLPVWVVIGAGAALGAAILLAGWITSRRLRAGERKPPS